MNIALFTYGRKSIIASNEGHKFSLDSILLYQDPELFSPRFLFQLHDLVKIDDMKVDNIIIGLTGHIDGSKNRVIESRQLNDISRIGIYNGFDYNYSLKEYISKERIFLANSVLISTLGIMKSYENIPFPCMVLLLDDEPGVGYINNTGSIMPTEWSNDYVESIGTQINKALGREGIIDLLFDNKIDIVPDYTDYLAKSIEYLIRKYSQFNQSVRSVCILGNKTKFIKENLLKNKLKEIELLIAVDNSIKQDIILKGCFALPAHFRNQRNRVVKIKYFSEETLIHDFTNFQNCIDHFISVKPISVPENHYKIFYSDETVKIVSMREMNDITELEKYRF